MKENNKMQLEQRELAAIQKLMLGDKGININSLVEDLCPNPESKDMVAVKIACHLSGLMPKFQPIHGFYKDCGECFEAEIISESTILGMCQVRQIRKWRKDYNDGVYKPVENFQETIRQEVISLEKDIVPEIGLLNIKIEEQEKPKTVVDDQTFG